MIAHEMRNPLTSIVRYTQLLQRRGNHDERALATIAAQARQLNRLIGDLLDSARLEPARRRLQPGWMDLSELARAATEQALLASPRHAVRLETLMNC